MASNTDDEFEVNTDDEIEVNTDVMLESENEPTLNIEESLDNGAQEQELAVNSTNNNNSSIFNLGLEKFQHNIYNNPKHTESDLEYYFKALPFTFFSQYEDYQIYENSKKIVVPKELLFKISQFDNITLPIYVKINDLDIIFGIIDYFDYIDHIYLPTETFYNFNFIENEELKLSVIKNKPPNATLLGIKPLSEEFYRIQDIKHYLETTLKKMVISLTLDEVIRLPYLETCINIQIKEIEPAPIVSIFDLESVEINILPMVEPSCIVDDSTNKVDNSNSDNNSNSGNNSDYCNGFTTKPIMKTNFKLNSKPNSNNETTEANEDDKADTKFVSFSGKGNTLGSK